MSESPGCVEEDAGTTTADTMKTWLVWLNLGCCPKFCPILKGEVGSDSVSVGADVCNSYGSNVSWQPALTLLEFAGEALGT